MKLKRALGWLAMLLAAMVILLMILKESREPYLWLFADDLLRPKPPPLSMPVADGLAVHLYADPRPHIGKVARLQKGLVLVVDGATPGPGGGMERIEEGFGFGLPLIEFDGQVYLSRSASVEGGGETLHKTYHMDIVDTPSGFLRRKYEPVPSIGTVSVHYRRTGPGIIEVTADFSGLRVAWDRAYLMNEQGARFFTRYEEPGLAVEGEAFGRWQPTTARRGCIVAEDGIVRFCVETDDQMLRYYGRERYNQYYWIGIYSLSWAGIDLELAGPTAEFTYQIRLETIQVE
ncbi:MAG: hypothetical protein ACP5JJ_06150 [Anaerolineae bacterium]